MDTPKEAKLKISKAAIERLEAISAHLQLPSQKTERRDLVCFHLKHAIRELKTDLKEIEQL